MVNSSSDSIKKHSVNPIKDLKSKHGPALLKRLHRCEDSETGLGPSLCFLCLSKYAMLYSYDALQLHCFLDTMLYSYDALQLHCFLDTMLYSYDALQLQCFTFTVLFSYDALQLRCFTVTVLFSYDALQLQCFTVTVTMLYSYSAF